MTYVEDLAGEIQRHVPAGALPKGDTGQLFHLYALLVLTKGRLVSAEDVHNAWAVWMLAQDPKHHSIKPFAELDSDTQASDEPYVRAIRFVAERLERAPA